MATLSTMTEKDHLRDRKEAISSLKTRSTIRRRYQWREIGHVLFVMMVMISIGKGARLRVKSRRNRRRTLKMGNSDVVVFSSNLISDMELVRVSRTVQDEITNEHDSKPCSCFCRLSFVGSADADEPSKKVKCVCLEKGGVVPAENENNVTLASAPIDPSRFRYNYPAKTSRHHTLTSYGLLMSLDAGDKTSFNETEPSVWRDVKGGRDAHISGDVVFQEDVGGGSLRFGPGDGARAIVEGLDVSPDVYPSLTMEVWVRLESTPNDRGWILGNDGNDGDDVHDNVTSSSDVGVDASSDGDEEDEDSRAPSTTTRRRSGREIVAHDTRFSAIDDMDGAVAIAGADGAYISNIGAPTLKRWMHLVGVWQENGYSYVYRNGQRDVAATTTRGEKGLSRLVIGGHGSRDNFNIDGNIAVVNVYSRALTPNEIEENFCFMASRFKLHCPSDWNRK